MRAAIGLLTLAGIFPFSLIAAPFDMLRISDELQWNLRNLTYLQIQKPGNAIIDLMLLSRVPDRVVENNLRLDLYYSPGPMIIDMKPRFDLYNKTWESGPDSDEQEFSADVYFYEWSGRLSLGDRAFIDGGLQNLQWGPSVLLSPSNPFDQRNGKDNPYKEIPAADFVRAIWIPSSAWTLSAIANIGQGRKDYELDFQPTYALKIDYIFADGYASLIPSHRNNDPSYLRLGYYAGYNVSDRILGYIEGSVARDDTEILIGASYTTDFGPTFGIEYFYNSSGDQTTDIRQIISLPRTSLDWRDALFRNNYMLVQAYQQNLFGSLDYVVRGAFNADDSSYQTNLQIDYGLTDSLSLFTVATVNYGDDSSELSAVRDYQAMAGLQVDF